MSMSIFAEALVSNRDYKNAKVNGEAVGVVNARNWSASVKAIRIPAYKVREYRYAHMGDAEVVAQYDQTALYTALAPVIDAIGVVNGAKLNARNVAEEIIANVVRVRAIDTSDEMAHARCELKEARKAKEEEETDETIANFDQWKAEVARLESLPGNCKKIVEIKPESTFVKDVEIILGDAIRKQTLKTAEQVAAEEEAKRQARRAKTKAKKQAKKAQAQANAQ